MAIFSGHMTMLKKCPISSNLKYVTFKTVRKAPFIINFIYLFIFFFFFGGGGGGDQGHKKVILTANCAISYQACGFHP